VRRLLLSFFLLILSVSVLPALAQDASSTSSAPTTQAVPASKDGGDSVSPEVAKAEAAIVKKDWKTAEPILDTWLAAHPADARALFDAGYLADAQGRNDDAVAMYRKALDANPKSFEAEISLGLLLARLGKPAEARPVLETATTLDPGEAGQAAKARAWRALAQIAMDSSNETNGGKVDTAQASIDLLEALKLSPEMPADTLMAANLAEANGDSAGAEAAYRRLLKKDPDSNAAVAGLAHLLIAQKK